MGPRRALGEATARTPLLSHHYSHTTALAPLLSHHCSHTTTLTPLLSHHCSHTTARTPLLSHHCSHTTALTPLLSPALTPYLPSLSPPSHTTACLQNPIVMSQQDPFAPLFEASEVSRAAGAIAWAKTAQFRAAEVSQLHTTCFCPVLIFVSPLQLDVVLCDMKCLSEPFVIDDAHNRCLLHLPHLMSSISSIACAIQRGSQRH